MRVKATQNCFIENFRRRKNDVFTLAKDGNFNKRCMVKLTGKEIEAEEPEEVFVPTFSHKAETPDPRPPGKKKDGKAEPTGSKEVI